MLSNLIRVAQSSGLATQLSWVRLLRVPHVRETSWTTVYLWHPHALARACDQVMETLPHQRPYRRYSLGLSRVLASPMRGSVPYGTWRLPRTGCYKRVGDTRFKGGAWPVFCHPSSVFSISLLWYYSTLLSLLKFHRNILFDIVQAFDYMC